MEINLTLGEDALFEARSEEGYTLSIDGPADLGGKGAAMRPMQTLLSAMAGCSGIDVLLILQKQRQRVESFDIQIQAERADAIPAVFTKIHLHFRVGGDVDPKRLQRAVELSMTKYCSVTKMLEPTVSITYEASVS